jgi:serine/threonine protein kinase
VTGHQSAPPPKIEGLTFIRPLGAGGYADVHLYEQETPKRTVAVKVLRDSKLTDRSRREFTTEANTMAELADHPNIVSVYSAGIAADGRPYLTMNYYSRGTLADRVDRERVGVSETLRIGVQIASAVEFAHRRGILHRDIKPANILTNQFGQVGLSDFGIAGQITATDDDDDTGISVPWSPPEIVYSSAPATVQSDVYSLGATLWNLLVGRAPYEIPSGDNTSLVMMRRIRDSAVPSTGRPEVPVALERLLAQALAKDPAARPPTALDFARSLQSVEQDMQYARTDIVVTLDEDPEGDQLPTPSSKMIGDADRTKLRAPVHVNPEPEGAIEPVVQPVPAPPVLPEVPEPVRPTVRRAPSVVPETPSMPAAAKHREAASNVGATVKRQVAHPETADHSVATPVPAPTKRRPLRPAVLITALVGVVVLAAVFAIVLASGGDSADSAGAKATVTTGSTPDDLGPPGIPTVTASRAGGNDVHFTWTYSNDADSDTYKWQTSDGTRAGAVDAPELTLSSPTGTQTCVEVKVVRADGRNGALTWSDPGCSS